MRFKSKNTLLFFMAAVLTSYSKISIANSGNPSRTGHLELSGSTASTSMAEEFPGILKPTVYYFPVLDEDINTCEDSTKMDLHGAGGKVLLRVCPETEDACRLQGSCAIIQNEKSYSFNFLGLYEGQKRFFPIEDKCFFGFGVSNICLDPYYSIAADLSIYKPGQVIFVPAAVGLELPDGSKHNGYFVIRDRGSHIKGIGRFDFFSGEYSWRNPKNPFKKIKLGDIRSAMPYYLILGELANKVLEIRGYPNLPIIRIDPK